jgi:hypothetical protein
MLFLVVVLLHHTCATTLATSCDNHFVIVNRLASALSNEARSLKVYVDFIYRRHLGDTVSSSGGMAQRPRDYLRKALVCIDSAEDYSVPKPAERCHDRGQERSHCQVQNTPDLSTVMRAITIIRGDLRITAEIRHLHA